MKKNGVVEKKKKQWLKVLICIILLLGLSASYGVYRVRKTYLQYLQPVNSSTESKHVTIAPGSTVKEIAEQLKSAGLIRDTWVFEWYVRNQDLRDKLQAGTYSLRPNMSVPEIVDIIANGKVAIDLVTILPGQRLDQIAAGLQKAGFTKEQVTAGLNPKLYENHPALVDKPEGASLEGYLYPESFQKTATTSVETIVRASLDEMQKRLTPTTRKGITKQGLTVYEGIILASIIDKEVSSAKDKPTVAQVFLKRNRIGMQLGSDVTAFYGAYLAGAEPTVFFDSPYNTRLYAGFPPGPISNVSQSALEAIVNPSNTDYLYFVAGDDGVTYFSHTVEEHERLTREHCKKLCE